MDQGINPFQTFLLNVVGLVGNAQITKKIIHLYFPTEPKSYQYLLFQFHLIFEEMEPLTPFKEFSDKNCFAFCLEHNLNFTVNQDSITFWRA